MKHTKAAMLITLISLSIITTLSAQQQQISLINQNTGSSNKTVVVIYDSSEGALTTGLGFRLHFNSHLVEILDIELLIEDSNLGIQILGDDEDFDRDPSTDYYINAAWVDLSGFWPDGKELPAALYRVVYDTADGQKIDVFNATSSAIAVGYEWAIKCSSSF